LRGGGFYLVAGGKKGYGFVLWFFLGLFFGIISLLAIGFTPVNTIKNQTKRPTTGRNGEGSRRDYDLTETWKCPKCGNENPNNTYICKSCGYKIL
jgi:hypothetical protein